MRQDSADRRGKLVEDLSNVERLRERRQECLERFTPAAALSLLPEEPLVLEPQGEQVRDREHRLLVLRNEHVRLFRGEPDAPKGSRSRQ